MNRNKTLKKPVSILLSILMIMSCFSAAASQVAAAVDYSRLNWVSFVGDAVTVYERTAEAMTAGNKYLLASYSYPEYILKTTNGANGSAYTATVNTAGNTVYCNADGSVYQAQDVWVLGDSAVNGYAVSRDGSRLKADTGYYITRNNTSVRVSSTTANLTFGAETVYTGSYYLYYDSSSAIFKFAADSSKRLCIYKQKTVYTSNGAAALSRYPSYSVDKGTAFDTNRIFSDTGILYRDANGTVSSVAWNDSKVSYSWDSAVNTAVPGTYTMTVRYDGKVLGEIPVRVDETDTIVQRKSYTLVTPRTSGQYLDNGEYIIYNPQRGCVLAAGAANGGIAASNQYTITGNTIKSDSATVVTITCVNASTNQYTVRNDEGKYLNVGTTNAASGASWSNNPQNLYVFTNSNGFVAFCSTNSSNGYCLNAYGNTYFGTYANGLTNNENRQRLYKQTITNEVIPDFPAEGSTRLSKTATPQNFEETGVAKVDLGLTAVPPYYASGVDVLFITDVSNSMAWKAGTQSAPGNGETSKLQDMQSAVSTFIDVVLQTNNGSSMEGNNTVSFVTFGGWDPDRHGSASSYSSSYIDPTRTLLTAQTNPTTAKNTVNNITFNMPSSNEYYLSFDGRKYSDASHKGYGGTNYDYGFMEGYDCINAIKNKYRNETGTNYADSERQIFVIFITDGAPTNFNGLMYKKVGQNTPNYQAKYDPSNSSGGSTYAYQNSTAYEQNTWYNYIRNNSHVWATNVYNTQGVVDMNTIGIDYANGGFQAASDYWIFTESAGYPLRNVLETLVADATLENLEASGQEELAEALAAQAKVVSSLASYANVTDKIGNAYNLQMSSKIYNEATGKEIDLAAYGIAPTITVYSYPTVHLSDVGRNGRTTADIGTRTGAGSVIEKITFNADGTQAYSNLLGNKNILKDGVIHANYFTYNNNSYPVTVNGTEIPAESFLWNVGKFTEDELVLEYYVYLDGAADYSVEDGIYPTNEYANVTYKDYEGNDVAGSFPKPNVPWSNEAKLTVNKVWADSKSSHAAVTAYVAYEDTDGTRTRVSEDFTLSASNNWTYETDVEFSQLSGNGKYIVIDAVSGYVPFTTELVQDKSGNLQTNHYSLSLINVPDDGISFTVSKTWADTAVDSHSGETVEVELYCNNVATGRKANLTSANNWTYTFTGLSMTASDGSDAVYTAVETSVPTGYVAGYGEVVNTASSVPAGATVISDGGDNGITVYKTSAGKIGYIVPVYSQTISNDTDTSIIRLCVNKVWDDTAAHDAVTATVAFRYNNGTEKVLAENVVLSAQNNWTANVAVENITSGGSYVITENDTEGYVSIVSGVDVDAYNRATASIYNVTPPKTSLTAKKEWSDGDTTDHSYDGIEIALCVNGVETLTTAVLDESNDWTYTFSGLDYLDGDGNVISYSIVEHYDSMLYTADYSDVVSRAGRLSTGYTLAIDGGAGDISVYENTNGVAKAAAPTYEQTVTNSSDDTTFISVSVDKSWSDTLDHDEIICAIGYRDSDGETTIVSRNFALSAANGWKATVDVVECDLDDGSYVLLEQNAGDYIPVFTGLEIDDTPARQIDCYVPVTSLEANAEYVIVYNHNSVPYAAAVNGNYVDPVSTGFSFTDETVTVDGVEYSGYLTATSTAIVWTAKASGANFRLNNTASNKYIYFQSNNSWALANTRTTDFVYSGNRLVNSAGTYEIGYSNSSTAGFTRASKGSGVDLTLYKHVTAYTPAGESVLSFTNVTKPGNQTVLIDYGLPVNVSVKSFYAATENMNATIVGVAAADAEMPDYTTTMAQGFGKTATYAHGTVSFTGRNLTYTPTDMMMSEKEIVKLCIAADYDDTTIYFYVTVTVVPATIMYYEDSFVTFTDTANNKWGVASGENSGYVQDEDRPGYDEVTARLDADNVYGYDNANLECSTFSNGTAHYVNVKNGDYAKNGKKWPTATFTFTGTAFDLIAMCSEETGFITVSVYKGTAATGAAYKNWIVDTYYGFGRSTNGYIRHEWYYMWDGWHVRNEIVENEGEVPESQKLPSNLASADTSKTYVSYEINYTWEPVEFEDNAAYQIPVMKSGILPYDTYTVVIQVSYTTFYDHTAQINPATGKKDYTNGNYSFYLDAIRTYAPVEDYDAYNYEYYTADSEGWPQFLELRDNIIAAVDIDAGDTAINAPVFIECDSETDDLTDYRYFGPNNETYLAPGQAIAFGLEAEDNGRTVDKVHIGAKKLFGDTVVLTSISGGERTTFEVYASTDMYYDISNGVTWNNDNSGVIVVTNISDAYVSLTNIKITYKEAPVFASAFTLAPEDVSLAMSMAKAAYIAGNSECYHNYEFELVLEPTAEKCGVIRATCADCGDYFDIETPILGERDYRVIESVEATDTADGYVVYTYDFANGAVTFTETVPAIGTEEDDGASESENGSGIKLSLFGKISEFFRKLVAFITNIFKK